MIAKLAPSLGALALISAAGLSFQALLPRPLERGRAARLGLAFLLGCAWIGLALWSCDFLLGTGLGRGAVLVLIAIPAVAAAIAVAMRRSAGGLGVKRETGARTRTWFGAVAALVISAQSVALLAHAAAEPVTDFDGRMTWGTQARYLAAADGVLPPVLLDARAFVIHPRYPILLPILQVASTGLAGDVLDSFAVRPLYALFLPAFAAALWPTLRRAGGARGAAVAALLLFAAPLVLRERDAGPLGTYSDFPLAAFLGAGFALLLHPRLRRESWRGWAAGLLLAAAAASKNEGMILAVAALGAAWLVTRRRGAIRGGAPWRPAVVLLLGLILIVAWRVGIPNRNDEGYFESFSVSTLLTNLPERAGPIVSKITALSLDRARWGWLWWLAPALFAAGAGGLRRRACRAAALLVAAEAGLVATAYSVVGDLYIVEVTWSRFLLQVAAPLAILLAAASGRIATLAARRSRRH